MVKIKGYIQVKQSKAILWHGGMTQETAEHFLTSRGLVVADHTIVLDASNVDVQGMIDIYDESIKTYDVKRKEEYDLLNQFEMIGEDSINGTTIHKDTILAIKAKYPKP